MDTRIAKHVRVSLVLLAPVLFLSILILILNMTSPVTAGPVGILAVLLFFYAFAASVIFAVFMPALAMWRLFSKRSQASNGLALRLAGVLAVGPVFIVALNTLGNIGLVEVTLVVALVCLACFYVVRRGYDKSDL